MMILWDFQIVIWNKTEMIFSDFQKRIWNKSEMIKSQTFILQIWMSSLPHRRWHCSTLHCCCCLIPSYLPLFVSAAVCAPILAVVGILSKLFNFFNLQTQPVPYSQVVFIQAHKEGKSPVPVVFALLSKKVCLFYSWHWNIIGPNVTYSTYPYIDLVRLFNDFKNGKVINF
jgi:hypothetical protein